MNGLYRNLDDNQVKRLIKATRCVAFFVEDIQRVTLIERRQ